jgi:cbb3-type cytochrome oxidase subunit 3
VITRNFDFVLSFVLWLIFIGSVVLVLSKGAKGRNQKKAKGRNQKKE